MAQNLAFSLAEVLEVAKAHPFYCSHVPYPPDEITIRTAKKRAALSRNTDLKKQKLLWKKDLYTAIERLVNDTSPQNTYRHGVYTSVTGGGGTGSRPLFFATDAQENRRHRGFFGDFLRDTGVVQHGDWVLSLHSTGDLYRSLDLMLEILENAGASVLAAGNRMESAKVVELLQNLSVNVLTGDASQIIGIVHYISTLAPSDRSKVVLNKLIYTSEAFTSAQRMYVDEVLGPVKIFSVLGSAEGGPYGASNSDLTNVDRNAAYADFIIDTRMTLIEILPISLTEDDDSIPDPLPEGETGLVVQTSLARLRNPLLRYVTGDVGSLHPLTDKAKSQISEELWPYLRIFRLQGRDRRFSFEWVGEYIDFQQLNGVMSAPEMGILQWQVILDTMKPSMESSLEIRVLCAKSTGQDSLVLPAQVVIDRIEGFFCVYEANRHRFQLTFVNQINDFELSETGRKVIKFIDRYSC